MDSNEMTRLNHWMVTLIQKNSIIAKAKQFFSHDIKYIDMLLKIINGESELSIRIIDWFVAIIQKKNDTYYMIKTNGKKDQFYVHTEYKNQLNGCSKIYFDPFAEEKNMYHYLNDDVDITFMTSIGQLNFLSGRFSTKVL